MKSNRGCVLKTGHDLKLTYPIKYVDLSGKRLRHLKQVIRSFEF
jgi:hypothetical protein